MLVEMLTAGNMEGRAMLNTCSPETFTGALDAVRALVLGRVCRPYQPAQSRAIKNIAELGVSTPPGLAPAPKSRGPRYPRGGTWGWRARALTTP